MRRDGPSDPYREPAPRGSAGPTVPWALLRTESFWKHYLDEEGLPPHFFAGGPLRVPFEVGGGSALVVQLSEHETTLFLRHRDESLTQLGWNDQAHWHPHALRWQEVDVISRAASRSNPELTHPGLALLLLYQFSALADADPVEQALRDVEAAWRWLGFSAATCPRLQGADFRGQHVRWVIDQRNRWYPLQDESAEHTVSLYSLRHPDYDDFPFDPLDALVKEAQANVDE